MIGPSFGRVGGLGWGAYDVGPRPSAPAPPFVGAKAVCSAPFAPCSPGLGPCAALARARCGLRVPSGRGVGSVRRRAPRSACRRGPRPSLERAFPPSLCPLRRAGACSLRPAVARVGRAPSSLRPGPPWGLGLGPLAGHAACPRVAVSRPARRRRAPLCPPGLRPYGLARLRPGGLALAPPAPGPLWAPCGRPRWRFRPRGVGVWFCAGCGPRFGKTIACTDKKSIETHANLARTDESQSILRRQTK